MPSSSRSNSSVPSKRSIPNREEPNQKRKNSSCSRSNRSVKSMGNNTNKKKKNVVNSSIGSRSRSKSPPAVKKRSQPNSSRSGSPHIRQKVKKNSSQKSKSSKRSSRSKRSNNGSPPKNNYGNRNNNDEQFRGRGRGRGRGDRGRGRGGFNNNSDSNGGGFNRGNKGYGNRQNNFNRNNFSNCQDNGYNNNNEYRRNSYSNERNNGFGNNNNSYGSNQRSPNHSNSFNQANSPNNRNRSPHSPLKIEEPKKSHQQIRLQQFYNEHKLEGWFKQKYHPITLISQQNERYLYIKKAQQQFLQQFNSSYYNDIRLSIADYKALGNLQFEEQEDGQVDERKMTSIVTLYLNDTVKIQGPPLYGIEKDSSTLYIPNVPKEIYRYEIYQVVSEIDGFKNLILSEPQRKLDFKRMAWIEYQDQIKANQALEKLKDVKIKQKKLEFTRACKRIRKAKIVINYPRSRIEQDLSSAVEISSKLDYEAKIYEKNSLYDQKFSNQLKKLEIFITYLRKVHFFDYFESKFYDSFRTLTIKSGMAVLLIQADPLVEIEIEELKKLDIKNSILKEKGSIEYRKKSIENINTFTDLIKTNLYKIHQFQPDIQKPPKYWKCHECRKKFLTIGHLVKHTTSRHEDLIEQQVEQAMLSIFMKNEEEWEKNKNERQTKEELEEKKKKKKIRRILKDFDCPEEEQDEELRQRLRPVSHTKKLINFLNI